MDSTKKLMCTLVAGITLGIAAPVFADSGHDYYREADHGRYGNYQRYDRHDHRGYGRDFDRRHVVVVERPYVVERQVMVAYPEPAPAPNIGLGAMIGAAIGGIIDSRQ